MDFDHEIRTFVKVWTIAIASQCYCYYVAAKIPTKSMMRLISLLPILYLLLMLPLSLHSIHLGGATAFFLAYLAIFKLLLFAFDSGPLSSPPPARLLHFISIALLPINHRQRSEKPSKGFTMTKLVPNKAAMWALKTLVLCTVIYVRKDYREYLHPYLYIVLFLLHQYLALEIGYALSVALPQAMFGFELEPHFKEPYLATSIQVLWGRRWNLIVSNTLRPLVHNQVKRISIARKGGDVVERKNTAKTPSAAAPIFLPVMASFGISAVMHELLFYYVTRARPSGEMLCYFILQGLSLAIELKVKKALAHRVRIPSLVSGILTMSFLTVTTHWLFYPHLDRTGADARTLEECARMAEFVKAKISKMFFGRRIS